MTVYLAVLAALVGSFVAGVAAGGALMTGRRLLRLGMTALAGAMEERQRRRRDPIPGEIWITDRGVRVVIGDVWAGGILRVRRIGSRTFGSVSSRKFIRIAQPWDGDAKVKPT